MAVPEISPNDLQAAIEKRVALLKALRVFLDQHGFRVTHELWPHQSAVVFMVRAIDKSELGIELAVQEPCQEQLYFFKTRPEL